MANEGRACSESILRSNAADGDVQGMVGEEKLGAPWQRLKGELTTVMEAFVFAAEVGVNLAFLRTRDGARKQKKRSDDGEFSHGVLSSSAFAGDACGLWMKQASDFAYVLRRLGFGVDVVEDGGGSLVSRQPASRRVHVAELCLDETGRRAVRVHGRGGWFRHVDCMTSPRGAMRLR